MSSLGTWHCNTYCWHCTAASKGDVQCTVYIVHFSPSVLLISCNFAIRGQCVAPQGSNWENPMVKIIQCWLKMAIFPFYPLYNNLLIFHIPSPNMEKGKTCATNFELFPIETWDFLDFLTTPPPLFRPFPKFPRFLVWKASLSTYKVGSTVTSSKSWKRPYFNLFF